MTDDSPQFVARDAAVAVERTEELPGELSPDGRRTAGELAAFLEVADEGYAICICNSPLVRDHVLDSIMGRLRAKGVGMWMLELAAGERSITAVIRRALETPEFAAMERTCSRVAISVDNITDAVTGEEWESTERPAPIQGLNQQRDWVRKLGRPVLFWVSDWLAAKLPSLAPDFWVGRSVVFEFRTESEFRAAALGELRGDWTGFASPEEARRKVRIYEELARDEKDPGQRATQLANLGEVLTAMAEYDRAEQVLKQALALAIESHGEQHPNVGKVLTGLGLLLQELGRYREAEDYLSRALGIAEATGKEDARLATALSNLAMLYQDTNRLAEAEPLMRRALAIDEKSSGPGHPDVATRLNNLAGLYRATNRLAEAEPLYKRALAIDEKSCGPDHPDVATRLNNLAGLYQALNRLAEAEPLIKRSLAIAEKSYGPEHPGVAIYLNNLASLYKDTNRLAEAEPLMRRAVGIFAVSLGWSHPRSQKVANNYAGLLRAMGRSEDEVRQILAEMASRYGLKQG